MSRYYLDRMPHSVVFATSLNDLYENHRINFDETNIGAGKTRHTSLDWFLVPKERPSIDKASVKERYIDIPGTNGGLDLTESLTGFPLYDFIEGSFEFIILNERKLPILDSNGRQIGEKDLSWEVLNRDIRSFLNGKHRFMMLEDDPTWYYEGRFTVEKYDSSEASNSKIVITYKVYPFKKLSMNLHNSNPYNSFFDTLSLATDDIAELEHCFWNKIYVDVAPGGVVTFSGNTRGSLPCGDEAVPITFEVTKATNGLYLVASISSGDDTIIRDIKTPKGKSIVKERTFVLTNRTHKGVLYSDNVLALTGQFAPAFNSALNYSAGECISYTQTGSTLVWVLKAINDISAGEFDLTKWTVDTDAMLIYAFSTSASYTKGAYIYRNEDSVLHLYAANNNVSPGEFDPTDWTDKTSDPPTEGLYNSISVTIKYDIGVM